MKNSFVLFYEHKEIFDALTAEQAGTLIKAIFDYEVMWQEPNCDAMLNLAWIPIRQALDRSKEKYNQAVENGKKGGAPKGNKNANKGTGEIKKGGDKDVKGGKAKTTENNLKQPPSKINNLSVSVSVSDSVSDNVSENEKDVSPEPPVGAPGPRPVIGTKPEQGTPRGGSTEHADGVATTLPLNDGTEYPITWEQVREWSVLYPAVDVMQELRKMRGWAGANPERRKTKRGILKHVVNWLSKEQDKGAISQLDDRNFIVGGVKGGAAREPLGRNDKKNTSQTEGERLKELSKRLGPIGDTKVDY